MPDKKFLKVIFLSIKQKNNRLKYYKSKRSGDI